MTFKPIRMVITKEMYDKAKVRAEKTRNIPGAIIGGEGSIYGAIGEEMFQKFFPEAEFKDFNDYDFLYKGKKIEVKTKRCGGVPEANYSASVSLGKRKDFQKCDIYFFFRCHRDTREGWSCGWLTREEFLKLKRLRPKDSKAKSNGHVFKDDCYNVFHHQLHDPKLLEDI